MGRLRSLLLVAALCAAAPARAESAADWQPYIAEASRRFGVPVAWIARVLQAESGGRTTWAGRPITSRAGAMGVMQLMPATWAAMRTANGLGDDPYDPRDNILAGTAYLRAMYDRFGYPGLFAAYNAGPARYADYLATGRALPGETRAYLAKVTRQAEPGRAAPAPAAAGLFVVLATAPPAAGRPNAAGPSSGLFFGLSSAAPNRETGNR